MPFVFLFILIKMFDLYLIQELYKYIEGKNEIFKLNAPNRTALAIPCSEAIPECMSLILHPDYSMKVKYFCVLLLDRIQP